MIRESHLILCYSNYCIMCNLIRISQEGDKLTFEQYCLWNVYFITPEKPLKGEHSLNLLACWGPTVCKVYCTCTLYFTYVIIKAFFQVIDSFCFFSLQMHCKFTIYNVPWEKRKELLSFVKIYFCLWTTLRSEALCSELWLCLPGWFVVCSVSCCKGWQNI